MTAPPEPSLAQQIIDAGRELSAAVRARPRDEDRLTAARARLSELQEAQAQEVSADASAD